MKALIVDDESNIRKVLSLILSEFNFTIKEASSINEATQQLNKISFDLALIDLRLTDGSGLELLKILKSKTPETFVIIITAFASTENAVEAMKSGAYDYFIKPFNIDELRIKIKNIVNTIVLQKQARNFDLIADTFEGMIGVSDTMKNIFNMIIKIAPFDTSVLITGESGTGKELVAKAIHRRSPRSDAPFLTINCASLPAELLESELFGYTKGSFTGAYTSKSGLIEQANKGTLFLDEIGEMPLSLQAKLLRFLEDKKIRPIGGSAEIDVDVRIIAASNKDLKDEAIFRKDLFFRISTFQIYIPPLRERREDIPKLVEFFVKTFSLKYGKKIEKIDETFMNDLLSKEYLGNIRELRNIIERAMILVEDDVLKDTTHLVETCKPSPSFTKGFNLNNYLHEIEKDLLYKALQESANVKTKAAELLGISFREFRYRLSKFEKAERSVDT
ncbi:MAG: sigma-54 dependent transcriptional regulator [Thermodesulfovibrionales bacterium]|nr:sigma-54 dependent transcriptional regulator [Thermodesulfovibrionales bacterium]